MSCPLHHTKQVPHASSQNPLLMSTWHLLPRPATLPAWGLVSVSFPFPPSNPLCRAVTTPDWVSRESRCVRIQKATTHWISHNKLCFTESLHQPCEVNRTNISILIDGETEVPRDRELAQIEKPRRSRLETEPTDPSHLVQCFLTLAAPVVLVSST